MTYRNADNPWIEKGLKIHAPTGAWQDILRTCRTFWREKEESSYKYYAEKLQECLDQPENFKDVDLSFILESLFDSMRGRAPGSSNCAKHYATELRPGLSIHKDYIELDEKKRTHYKLDYPTHGKEYMRLRDMRMDAVQAKFDANGLKLDQGKEHKQLGTLLAGNILAARRDGEKSVYYASDDIFCNKRALNLSIDLILAENPDGTRVNNIAPDFYKDPVFWEQMPFCGYDERHFIADTFGGYIAYEALTISQKKEAQVKEAQAKAESELTQIEDETEKMKFLTVPDIAVLFPETDEGVGVIEGEIRTFHPDRKVENEFPPLPEIASERKIPGIEPTNQDVTEKKDEPELKTAEQTVDYFAKTAFGIIEQMKAQGYKYTLGNRGYSRKMVENMIGNVTGMVLGAGDIPYQTKPGVDAFAKISIL